MSELHSQEALITDQKAEVSDIKDKIENHDFRIAANQQKIKILKE